MIDRAVQSSLVADGRHVTRCRSNMCVYFLMLFCVASNGFHNHMCILHVVMVCVLFVARSCVSLWFWLCIEKRDAEVVQQGRLFVCMKCPHALQQRACVDAYLSVAYMPM